MNSNTAWTHCAWKIDEKGFHQTKYFHFDIKCPRSDCDSILKDNFDICEKHGKVSGIAVNKVLIGGDKK